MEPLRTRNPDYKVGDWVRIVYYDQGDEYWIDHIYKIVDVGPSHINAHNGIYSVEGVTGNSGDHLNGMNVDYFDQAAVQYYGNEAKGTISPALRILYGSKEEVSS